MIGSWNFLIPIIMINRMKQNTNPDGDDINEEAASLHSAQEDAGRVWTDADAPIPEHSINEATNWVKTLIDKALDAEIEETDLDLCTILYDKMMSVRMAGGAILVNRPLKPPFIIKIVTKL